MRIPPSNRENPAAYYMHCWAREQLPVHLHQTQIKTTPLLVLRLQNLPCFHRRIHAERTYGDDDRPMDSRSRDDHGLLTRTPADDGRRLAFASIVSRADDRDGDGASSWPRFFFFFCCRGRAQAEAGLTCFSFFPWFCERATYDGWAFAKGCALSVLLVCLLPFPSSLFEFFSFFL